MGRGAGPLFRVGHAPEVAILIFRVSPKALKSLHLFNNKKGVAIHWQAPFFQPGAPFRAGA